MTCIIFWQSLMHLAMHNIFQFINNSLVGNSQLKRQNSRLINTGLDHEKHCMLHCLNEYLFILNPDPWRKCCCSLCKLYLTNLTGSITNHILVLRTISLKISLFYLVSTLLSICGATYVMFHFNIFSFFVRNFKTIFCLTINYNE